MMSESDAPAVCPEGVPTRPSCSRCSPRSVPRRAAMQLPLRRPRWAGAAAATAPATERHRSAATGSRRTRRGSGAPVGVGRRQAQHDLGDADRRVVLELAGVGQRAERDDRAASTGSRPAASHAPRAARAARRGCRRRRSGSSRRRTRRCGRTASGPARRRCSTGGRAGLHRLGPRPRRRESTCSPSNAADVVAPQRLHREHVLAGDVAAVGASSTPWSLDLVLVPAEADAEHEPAAREVVERGDRLGGHDRVALRDEADAGAEQDALGHRGRGRERDERVERALVLLGAARRRRWAAACAGAGDVGVLGHVERVEAAGLGLAGERRPGRIDRSVANIVMPSASCEPTGSDDRVRARRRRSVHLAPSSARACLIARTTCEVEA